MVHDEKLSFVDWKLEEGCNLSSAEGRPVKVQGTVLRVKEICLKEKIMSTQHTETEQEPPSSVFLGCQLVRWGHWRGDMPYCLPIQMLPPWTHP